MFEDDETLQMYIEESLDHLADIESDLLTIEEGGENIDLDLVNNVFRDFERNPYDGTGEMIFVATL